MTEPATPSRPAPAHALPSALLHDLRSPLNHIIGFSEMLIEQAPEQQDKNFLPDLQKLQAAGKRLLSLIEANFYASQTTSPSALITAVEGPGGTSVHSAVAKLSDTQRFASTARTGLVLVVDDVDENRDILSRQLRREGYEVATSENGRQALDRLAAETFDLVLLDIMMPEMDGYEVLQRLKADDALRHIPVIMISALSELDSVVRCIGLGAEDYLPKPFEPTLLKARIGACLEKKRARDREQELASALRAKNTEMAVWRKAQEADLALARTTQQGIVNAAHPPFAGWQLETIYKPFIQVGGDVYGWRAMDHGACLVWGADATGHGVAAALFTTLVALLFDHASALSGTAHGVLARVNAEFYTVLRGRSFMSACCAVVHPNGRLSFAGAGHPALLIRRRNGSVETFPSLITMIGLYPAAKIDATVTTLAPGDTALLYTDGLYSSKRASGERLTADTLVKAFARLGGSADFLPELIGQLEQSSGSAGFDDDVAAIALHRE
ncbi:MAG: response regulator [Chthoniobacterales bacterium]